MKKFINDPENLTSELLEGLALSNPDIVSLEDGNLVVNKKLKDADRVTIVTLGGTGHEPAISGFVGEGMIDISVAGNIFAAPGPQSCVEAIKMADKGHGVLFVVLNHAGDMLTGNLTMKQVKKLGIKVAKVVTQEDVANAPRSNADDRRGLPLVARDGVVERAVRLDVAHLGAGHAGQSLQRADLVDDAGHQVGAGHVHVARDHPHGPDRVPGSEGKRRPVALNPVHRVR